MKRVIIVYSLYYVHIALDGVLAIKQRFRCHPLDWQSTLQTKTHAPVTNITSSNKKSSRRSSASTAVAISSEGANGARPKSVSWSPAPFGSAPTLHRYTGSGSEKCCVIINFYWIYNTIAQIILNSVVAMESCLLHGCSNIYLAYSDDAKQRTIG